jgi:hypothetical protein
MVPPHDGGAAGAGGTIKTDGGAGKTDGGGGGVGGKGGGGGGGTGGKGGSGGAGGSTLRDASCNLLTDALVEHSTTACNALFNFESGTQGATPASSAIQGAFKRVIQGTTPNTYCGAGSLAITASFSGTTGTSTKGEVDIPLGTDGGTANLAGKTVSVHVSANPACDAALKFNVSLNTTTGSSVILRIEPVTANWSTATVTLPAATDGGANSATALALQAFSFDGYVGTIYVDEIDIR